MRLMIIMAELCAHRRRAIGDRLRIAAIGEADGCVCILLNERNERRAFHHGLLELHPRRIIRL